MKTLTVETSTNNYQIVIKENIRFSVPVYLKKTYSSIIVNKDETVGTNDADDVVQSCAENGYDVQIKAIPSRDASKSMEMYEALQTSLLKAGVDRKGLIIALGGGVVGDLAGFV